MTEEEEREIIKKHNSKNGKKGGKTTLERYGKDHFKEISRKAVEAHWGKKSVKTVKQTP